MNAKHLFIKLSVVLLAVATIGVIGATSASAQVSITVTDPTAFVSGGQLHMVVSAPIPGGGGLLYRPSSATFTASGAANYNWSVSASGGQIDATGNPAQYLTPASITGAQAQVTVTVANAADPGDTATYTVNVYNIVATSSPTAARGLATGDTLTVTATGGTGTYQYEIVDANPANAASIVATTGVVTADNPGTFKVRARDDDYGDFAVDNGFRSNKDDFPLITVVTAINITGGVSAVTSGQTVDFDATGGSSANYTWTADAGSIDSDGLFTPPTVTSGNEVVTIRAYDSVYGPSSSSPIFDEETVTVYAPVAVDLPSGYDGGDSSTWPLLASPGATYTVFAAGGTDSYDWTAENTSKTPNNGALSLGTGSSATINIDALFAHDGAGAYLIQADDAAQASFVPSSFKVRVPVRIAPSSGSFSDSQNQVFTATGTSVGFTWEQTDVAGNTVNPTTVGGFDAQGNNSVTLQNPPAPAQKLTELTNFRLRATTVDPDLVADGLQTAITDVLVMVPLYSVTITVNDASSGNPVENALVNSSVSDQAPLSTAANGEVTFNNVLPISGGYVMTAVKDGYYPKSFTVADITVAVPAVSLEPIPTPLSSVSGTVSPAGSGITVQIFDNADDVLTDNSGNAVIALANPASGAYNVEFPNTFIGNYTIVFTREGYVTNADDNAGVLTNQTAGTNKDITLQPETAISVETTTGMTSFDVSITAAPAFNNSASEIVIYEGTDASAPVITGDFSYAGGTNSYDIDTSVAIPAPGDSESIYIRADTSTPGRDASSNYYAELIATYVGGQPDSPTATGAVNPGTGGTVESTGGTTKVFIPAGGVLTPDTLAVAIIEYDSTKAGAPDIVTGLTEVTIDRQATGDSIPGADIQQLFITISFDPSKVTRGCFEAGTCTIYHAPNLADMMAGNKTAIPSSQIVPEPDYDIGRVMFWTDSVSAFGVGAAASSPAASGGGGGGGGCFVQATTSGAMSRAPIVLLVVSFLAFIGLGVVTALRRSQ